MKVLGIKQIQILREMYCNRPFIYQWAVSLFDSSMPQASRSFNSLIKGGLVRRVSNGDYALTKEGRKLCALFFD